MFEQIKPGDSGIHFSNRIIENDSINILSYDYVYNGGGVGIGDFNNDGLEDVFFSANQAGNKLYLNKGNFKFEDVSKKASIEGENKWCTAAIVVDINADNLLDIYVPVSSTNKTESSKRENILYVNQGVQNGVPVFKELSKEYGVNDNGFSEGAAFFDYDNDGDLDLYVLTNVIDDSPNYFRKKVIDGTYPNNDRLYENSYDAKLGHAVFKDVSKKAGILIEGFGLGINICDINRDGWKDIYVTNDYASDDILYINNKNGTFSDQAKLYFKHTSNAAMGNDVADINNDGLADMIALDMMPEDNVRKKMFVSATNSSLFRLSDELGYIYQYMRNTLQLNSGLNKSFSEISLMAGVGETDWSWTPSLADFDNDGNRDLLITNGFPKDVTDKDFMAFRSNSELVAGKKYLLGQIPKVKIGNYAYKNTGKLKFSDVSKEWGIDEPSFSSGAAYADLDNDGDLDYVVNNTNDSGFVFKNNLINSENEKSESNYLRIRFKGGKDNPYGQGAMVISDNINNQKFLFESTPYRGYKSSTESKCHIGLGKLNSVSKLKVIWPNGMYQELTNIRSNQEIVVDEKNATLKYSYMDDSKSSLFLDRSEDFPFIHKEFKFLDFNIQNLIPFKLSQLGPGAAVSDINNDGLDDVFIGGAKFHFGSFMIQNEDGSFKPQALSVDKDTMNKKSEDTGVLLFDADNDGFKDLYIVSGGNEDYAESSSFNDRFYVNVKGKFELKSVIPQLPISGSCVRASDFDNDGDLDLFVGGRFVPTKYPKASSSFILRNDSKPGNVKFTNITNKVLPSLLEIGLITDGIWSDFNNDGWLDLILVGDYQEIMLFKNNKGSLSKVEKTGLENYLGYWNSINGADFDHDGDIDYIVGNIGDNLMFRGSQKEPATILSGDFDNNGLYEVLPFLYLPSIFEGKRALVPYNGKEDISKQYNPIRTRFTTYKEYAESNIENVLTKEELKIAKKHIFNFSSSSYIENLGDGKFKLFKLPVLAQISQITGIEIQDFNLDGNLDAAIIGNNFGVEFLAGQLDASNGLILLGDGKGKFKTFSDPNFVVSGDAKALVSVINKNGTLNLLATQNNGASKFFKTKIKGKVVSLKQNERLLEYIFKGKKIKKEVYFGASYLSQSSRSVLIPSGATQLKIR
jgi:enediyne biosynthesis protein E4